MRGKLIFALLVALIGSLAAWHGSRARVEAADESGPMLVHNVFFTLKESTPEGRKKLAAACKQYLSKHEGEVYFAAGPLAEDYKREVNDRDFDVALTIVFKNKKAHDQYQ